MSHEKLIGRGVILGELTTNIGVGQTSSNLPPIAGIGDVVPEPLGEAVEAVLLVSPAGHGVTAITSGDNEGKDENDEEENYEDGHTEEVKSEKAPPVPVRTHEACEGDEQDEDTQQYNRPSEGADALVVGFGGQPNARSNYGYGAEEGYEV